METAEQKNDRARAPLTAEELADVAAKYLRGTIAFTRRAPVTCVCGHEMWGQYIGHRHEIAEWLWRCSECQNEYCG